MGPDRGRDDVSVLAAMRGSLGTKKGYTDLVMAESPLAYWPLGDGVTETDRSGNARNGTWTSAPSSVQLLPNVLGGISQGGTLSCSVPYGSWRQNTRSIEVWVKFTSTSQMAFLSDRESTERWGLYHGVNGNFIQFNAAYGGGIYTNFVVGPAVNDGLLHHVVATIDGSNIRLYVDGIYQNIASNTYSPSTSSQYMWIGSENATRRWNGQMAHAALYSNTLSAGTITAHWNAGRDPLLLGFDSFAKPDSSSTLGTMPVGGGWTTHNGSGWGINTSNAYVWSAPNNNEVCQATMDVGTANMEVEWVFQTHDRGYANPLFRADSSGMGLFIADEVGGSSVNMFKQVNPTTNSLVSSLGAIGPMVAGDTYKIRCVGTTIYFYRNGTLQSTSTGITDYQTNTRAGMQQYIASGHISVARWASFQAKAA